MKKTENESPAKQPDSTDAAVRNILKKRILHFALCAVLLLLDQLTKVWARGTLKTNGKLTVIPKLLSFDYLENNGAIWGIFGGKTVFLLIFTVLTLAVVIWFYFKVPMERRYLPVRLLIVFIAAGALGNIIDRFRFGYVTDFLKFEFIQFPTFNVADIYITVSVFVSIFLVLFVYRDELKEE
ncbi:MAG: signal peptidase II [Lachnospiraceae bacterium]|nr:signal peptidase II [Lachnospiraceae bacterium]